VVHVRIKAAAGNGPGAFRAGSASGELGLLGPDVATPVLTRWGASAPADLVYRALTMDGRQSAAELGRSLGLATEPILAALDELQGLGIAEVVDDAARPDLRRWLGYPPESVVAVLRERQAVVVTARHRLKERLNALESVEISAAEVRAARPITTATAVRRRLADLLAALRHEHLAMDADWTAAVAAAAPDGSASQPLRIQGITRLFLGLPAAAGRSGTRPAVAGAVGLQYRELPSLPLRMTILDRRTALVPMDPASGSSGGVWEISSPSVVRQLVGFFLRQWHAAGDPARRPAVGVPLTDRERAIIALLATGDTDAAVAMSLGLSLRTIAYTVKELMERCGVRSRFQLGLVLGGQGGSGPLHVPAIAMPPHDGVPNAA
jgi:DNA-binding CsgD family transcriptional regulator